MTTRSSRTRLRRENGGKSRIRPRPLPAGAATVHHARTLHYTTGNFSASSPRRALILTIGKPPVPRATPRTNAWSQGRRTF